MLDSRSAGQLILTIQLQSHIAGAGNGHSVLFRIPCIHLQVTEDDLQSLGRIIDDLHHIVGGGLYAFGKGGGGVGSLVGLLLSGLFLFSLLLRSRLGGRLCGLLLGLGVILVVLDHLIGGLFGLFRLLGVGGLLLSLLLLVLLLLVLRGQQLLRGGLIALVLTLGGRVLGLPLALGLAGLFNLGGVFAGLFNLGGVLFLCVQVFGGLGVVAGVVAGDDDVICAVAILLDAVSGRFLGAVRLDGDTVFADPSGTPFLLYHIRGTLRNVPPRWTAI